MGWDEGVESRNVAPILVVFCGPRIEEATVVIVLGMLWNTALLTIADAGSLHESQVRDFSSHASRQNEGTVYLANSFDVCSMAYFGAAYRHKVYASG